MTLITTLNQKTTQALDHFKDELITLRSDKPNPALLNKITISVFETPTPLAQVASISVMQPNSLLIEPWDKANLSLIEKAIQESDLGLNPQNNGGVIHVNLPPLTAERRQEHVKILKKMAEEAKIAIKQIRESTRQEINRQEKNKEINQDQQQLFFKEIDQIIQQVNQQIIEIVKQKEIEITTI